MIFNSIWVDDVETGINQIFIQILRASLNAIQYKSKKVCGNARQCRPANFLARQ